MTKKILIAEDNPDNRQLLEDILDRFRMFGVTILTAENGRRAYELALSERPDVILLDVMMPEMSGFDVCEKLKADPDTARMYIIMISAKIQQEDRRHAAVLGVDEYLTKPFDAQLVVERVGQALGMKNL